MNFKYGLEDRPPLKENLLYGLQWLAVTVPAVLIIGKLLGSMQGSVDLEILYLQKLFAVIGIVLLVQTIWGHRMPLVLGPATVLLIGILASSSSSPNAIATSILLGGVLLALLAISGLFAYLRRLFTPRVVAVILLLVAFTMTPTIMNLISSPVDGVSSAKHLAFAFVFVLLMFTGQRFLTGLWKSTLILWAMIAGSLAYFLINPGWAAGANGSAFPFLSGFFSHNSQFIIEPGVLVAFLLCFLGLSINDLGSIQAVGSVLQVKDMPGRITRGITVTGLGNALAGFMGVIGPVNFSFSPGVIASTGCAARRTLIPTAVAMLALAFLPRILFYLSFIPAVVIGCALLFIMCTQVAAGLMTAFGAMEEPAFDNALLIGLPLLVGIIVAFLPADVLLSFPVSLRPILGNGFVMGVLVSLILEHVIFRKREARG